MKLINKRKKEQKTIYIHIGFMKTGTSAFQSFINDVSNKNILMKNDIYYPEINKKAQNYLAFSLLDTIPPKVQHILPIERKTLYKNLINEIKECEEGNILLTSESYSLISSERFLGNNTPKKLYKLLKDNNFEIKIIIFIRRQDEYLESLYNQIIKRHNFTELYHKDINQFYIENIDLFDYQKIIDSWAEVFGENNLIVKIYKKEENSVTNIFSSIVGNVEIKGVKNEIINEKISSKTLEFLRIANKFEINKERGNQNDLLINLTEEVFSKFNKTSSQLSFEQSKKIMKDYFEKNKLFANKYLSGDYSWCNPELINYKNDHHSDNKIDIEDAIHVAVKIWNHFQKQIS